MKHSPNSHKILMFLKFGNEENILDMYENGTIFMNPIQYFRSFEDAELRGDRYEGVSEIINFPPGTFEIPVLNFKGEYINIHIRHSYNEVLGNIYSLYCISSFAIPNPYEFKIDESMLRFGTHCLMIRDNRAFLNRIKKILKKQNLEYSMDFVSYYDKYKTKGKINLFQKPLEFSYQNEFRLYVKTDYINPISIQIGSLKNIAQIVPSSDIMPLRLVNNNT